MELLNLDSLVNVRRQVELGGKQYDVADQSVEQMLAGQKLQKLFNSSEQDPEALVESMLELAQTILPSCPAEELGRLEFKQLNSLIEFAAASDEEVVSKAQEGSEVEFTDTEKKS